MKLTLRGEVVLYGLVLLLIWWGMQVTSGVRP